MMYRIGQRVQITSGDVTSLATIESVHSKIGIFVKTDIPVPTVVGEGGDYETIVDSDRLWIHMNGHALADRDGVRVGFLEID